MDKETLEWVLKRINKQMMMSAFVEMTTNDKDEKLAHMGGVADLYILKGTIKRKLDEL